MSRIAPDLPHVSVRSILFEKERLRPEALKASFLGARADTDAFGSLYRSESTLAKGSFGSISGSYGRQLLAGNYPPTDDSYPRTPITSSQRVVYLWLSISRRIAQAGFAGTRPIRTVSLPWRWLI